MPRGEVSAGSSASSLRASRLRDRHQRRLPFQIGDAEPRQARLRGADQIARPAHRQIFLGDAKAVLGVADHLSAAARRFPTAAA